MLFLWASQRTGAAMIVQFESKRVRSKKAVNTQFQKVRSGRKLPVDPQPSWLGYSVGRWEGQTLVVDTIGFNDKAPLDIMGHPRSESMHLTERFSRRDFGHMEIQMTIDDPKTYTKPFTI